MKQTRATNRLFTTLLLMVSAAVLPAARAENIVFPAGSGILNVRHAEFGAKGDGVADDTIALQKALTTALGSHRIVYLPNGIYKVSDTLKWQNVAKSNDNTQGWAPFLQLQGQSRNGTIVRLMDGAAGFGDARAPKAVIQTGSSGSHGNKTYRQGEGNEAFENHLRNFCVETGNNKGAVGIDYQASNVGAMRDVLIRGQGHCGILLTRRDNGPGLIKSVSIEGFDYGIRITQEIAHITLENVNLKGQNVAGLFVRDAIVAARKIRSVNRVPAIRITGIALLSLFDSYFTGGTGAAIDAEDDDPKIYVRNLKTIGYTASVRLRGQNQRPILAEWSSDKPLGNSIGKLSLGLPVRETPEWYDPDPKRWAILPAPSGGDDTLVIQAALDSGRKTVFFRAGRYFISDTLRVPAHVRRIQGAGSQINTLGRLPDDKPMFLFDTKKAIGLTILDRFELGANDGYILQHNDPRTIVMRDLIVFGAQGSRNKTGAGPLFIEDVACGKWRFSPGTQVWGRQWNVEGGDPGIGNNGATVWGFGMKHEGGGIIAETTHGGRTELWGSFAYTFGLPPDLPAYVCTDSSLTLQLAGMTYMGANGFYDLLVKESQSGKIVELRRSQIVPRKGAATIPLYVSEQTAVSKNAPSSSSTRNREISKW